MLAGWIVALAEANGFMAQSTSVPGVAQRTGATIYYVELFPKDAAKKARQEPILAMMPVPGDVDIVIASEMMEAGRALMRGFVTARTTLIASTHRIYAISEKEPLGDGRRDTAQIHQLAKDTAGRFIAFDMDAAANTTGSFISAVLFGALAGSEALPFAHNAFEDIIRSGKKGVSSSLRGFELGLSEAAQTTRSNTVKHTDPATGVPPAPAVAPLLQRLNDDFAAPTHEMLRHGLTRVVDYQDPAYGTLYLDRMAAIHGLDQAQNGSGKSWRLTNDVARYLALKMTYEDTIRVADLKTRAGRFARFPDELGTTDAQIITVTEFMHPRVQELCDILPAALGRFILRSPKTKAALGVLFGKGRKIQTTSLRGFVLLYGVSGLKFMRRASLRFAVEEERTKTWLDTITNTAPENYALACEIAGLQRLIKGYGSTYDRGLGNFTTITGALDAFKAAPNAHKQLKTLKDAALMDEDGAALNAAMNKLHKGRKT